MMNKGDKIWKEKLSYKLKIITPLLQMREGIAGKVNISQSTYELVKDTFPCTYRGKIQAKNKGEIDMYFAGNI